MKKIIVVGAGVSGLAAAVRLQKLGYDVTLYEKEGQPGGKMNQIKENGFTFDVGPTIVMMPEIYREVFEFAGVDPNDYIPMEKVDPMLQLYFAQDEPLTFSNDLVELTKTLDLGRRCSRLFCLFSRYLQTLCDRQRVLHHQVVSDMARLLQSQIIMGRVKAANV